MHIGGKSNFKNQSQPLIKHKEQKGMKLTRKKKTNEPVNSKHTKSSYEESLILLKYYGTDETHRTYLC